MSARVFYNFNIFWREPLGNRYWTGLWNRKITIEQFVSLNALISETTHVHYIFM